MRQARVASSFRLCRVAGILDGEHDVVDRDPFRLIRERGRANADALNGDSGQLSQRVGNGGNAMTAGHSFDRQLELTHCASWLDRSWGYNIDTPHPYVNRAPCR